MNDQDYQVPFRFNGKINKLTFNLGPTQLAAEEQKKGRRSGRKSARLGTENQQLDRWRRLVRRCLARIGVLSEAPVSLNMMRSAT